MEQQEEADQQMPLPRRVGAPIIWWALVGTWLGLFVLDSALTGGGYGPSGSWMQLSIALILLGPFLPSLFFDENGQEFSATGMWAAARRHWSGVVGMLLMLSGVGLMVANLVLAPDTLRPSDWAFAVVFLLVPLISILGVTGPRALSPWFAGDSQHCGRRVDRWKSSLWLAASMGVCPALLPDAGRHCGPCATRVRRAPPDGLDDCKVRTQARLGSVRSRRDRAEPLTPSSNDPVCLRPQAHPRAMRRV